MRIQRFHGRNLEDALLRARAAHGENALVLGHEVLAGGQVTVAVGDPNAPSDPAQLLRPRPQLRAARAPESEELPGWAEIERRLARAGASPQLSQRVREAVRASGQTGVYAIDAAARALGELLPAALSPRTREGAHLLAFVGPAGAGKTTTLSKLALRLSGAGRRIALVALDHVRPGAVLQLAGLSRRLGVPLAAPADEAELGRALTGFGDRHAVLIDTAGRGASAPAGPALPESCERYLVLAANASARSLESALALHAPARPSAVVLTKLDETSETAVALERSAAVALRPIFLCDGQELGAHLHRPEPELVADLVLRGRIA
jgi:flagellar biosynthesis protein FlhF